MWPNYPVTEQEGTAFKMRQRMENLPSCAHVLNKTLNLANSRCCLVEPSEEIYQNIKKKVQGLCFSHLYILLFFDVVIAVAVVAS